MTCSLLYNMSYIEAILYYKLFLPTYTYYNEFLLLLMAVKYININYKLYLYNQIILIYNSSKKNINYLNNFLIIK